jgi:hypothetical protein
VKPSVGRIVHYVSYGTPGGEYTSQCRAAVITEVDTDPGEGNGPYEGVGLCVLNPTGQFFNRHLGHDEEGHAGGTWHWPDREN